MPGVLHKYNGSGKWLKGREDARSAAQIQWKWEVAEGERGCQECCTNTMEVGSG